MTTQINVSLTEIAETAGVFSQTIIVNGTPYATLSDEKKEAVEYNVNDIGHLVLVACTFGADHGIQLFMKKGIITVPLTAGTVAAASLLSAHHGNFMVVSQQGENAGESLPYATVIYKGYPLTPDQIIHGSAAIQNKLNPDNPKEMDLDKETLAVLEEAYANQAEYDEAFLKQVKAYVEAVDEMNKQ